MPPLYEDRFNAFTRRLDRLRRAVSWRRKRRHGESPVVLVEIRWRLGDEIMALPLYEAIKQAWPDARLAVDCTHPELLEGNPHVDAVNEPCAVPDRYVCLRDASRTLRRIEHYAKLAGVATPASSPRLHIADWSPPALAALPTGGFVAVSADASWPTKRWDRGQWRELIAMLRDAGVPSVELGRSENHEPEPLGAEVSLVDKTTVRDAACVLKRARAFIGSDSGLMHLALAVDTPAVVLFGPTDPAVLVGADPRLRAVTNGRPCQGCWNGEQRMREPGVCPLSIPDCLEPITPRAVFEAYEALAAESERCASSS